MTRLKQYLLFLLLLSVIFGCEDKKDEYYKRPEWLAGPIYQQLEQEGRFTIFIILLDSMGYDKILGKTGFFTLFAPNDSAFQEYFKQENISSVNQLDSQKIREIVQYAIVENGYTPHTLAAYQSAGGWIYGQAFRRLTRSSRKYYMENIKDENGNNINAYIKNEGTKYIPYFLDEFFLTSGVSSDNYQEFYPESEYTGFNVVDAKVLGDFIVAENGYIYELDKVILPLPNLEECLYELPEKENYSEFKNLLSVIARTELDTSDHSKNLPVYTKSYNYQGSRLYPEPNIEEYNLSSNLYQTFCYTMFVPDNTTLEAFENEKLLKYYNSMDELIEDRPAIITQLIQAHIYGSPIWHEDFVTHESSFGVLLNDDNVLISRIASNGFFYGISEILNTGKYFNSVYSEIFLHPDYTTVYEAINLEVNQSLINLLNSNEINYTLFLATDEVFQQTGYFYAKSLRIFYPTDIGEEKVTELLNTLVVRGDYDDLSGKGFLKTYGGDIISYDNNVIWGGGNIENNNPATIVETNKEPSNGTVYKMNHNILPPTKNYLNILQTPPAGASYAQFYQYLSNSGLIAGENIQGVTVGKNMAILVPTDDAILAAGLPPYDTADSTEQVTIKNFLLYHIIQNTKLPNSGSNKTFNIESTTGHFNVYREVTIAPTNDGFQITEGLGNTAVVINTAGSCNFSINNAAIYQIDRVLEYE